MADDDDDFGAFEAPEAPAPAPSHDAAFNDGDDDDFGDLNIAPLQVSVDAGTEPQVAAARPNGTLVSPVVLVHEPSASEKQHVTVAEPLIAQDVADDAEFGPAEAALPVSASIVSAASIEPEAAVAASETIEHRMLDAPPGTASAGVDDDDEFGDVFAAPVAAPATAEVITHPQTADTAASQVNDADEDEFGDVFSAAPSIEAPAPSSVIHQPQVIQADAAQAVDGNAAVDDDEFGDVVVAAQTTAAPAIIQHPVQSEISAANDDADAFGAAVSADDAFGMDAAAQRNDDHVSQASADEDDEFGDLEAVPAVSADAQAMNAVPADSATDAVQTLSHAVDAHDVDATDAAPTAAPQLVADDDFGAPVTPAVPQAQPALAIESVVSEPDDDFEFMPPVVAVTVSALTAPAGETEPAAVVPAQVSTSSDDFDALQVAAQVEAAPAAALPSSSHHADDADEFGSTAVDEFDAFAAVAAPPAAVASTVTVAAPAEPVTAAVPLPRVTYTTVKLKAAAVLPRFEAPSLPPGTDPIVAALVSAVTKGLAAEPLEWSEVVPMNEDGSPMLCTIDDDAQPPVTVDLASWDAAAIATAAARLQWISPAQIPPTTESHAMGASWKLSSLEDVQRNALPRPIRVAGNSGKRRRSVAGTTAPARTAVVPATKPVPAALPVAAAAATVPAKSATISVSHLDMLASLTGPASAVAPVPAPSVPPPAPALPSLAANGTPKVPPAAPTVPDPVKMSLAAFTQHPPEPVAPQTAHPRPAPAPAAATRVPDRAPAPAAPLPAGGLSPEEVAAIADSIVSALEKRLPDLLSSLLAAAP